MTTLTQSHLRSDPSSPPFVEHDPARPAPPSPSSCERPMVSMTSPSSPAPSRSTPKSPTSPPNSPASGSRSHPRLRHGRRRRPQVRHRCRPARRTGGAQPRRPPVPLRRPAEILAEVAASDTEGSTEILQRAYTAPIRPELIGRRVEEIKSGGVAAAVSVTPPNAKRLAPAIRDARPTSSSSSPPLPPRATSPARTRTDPARTDRRHGHPHAGRQHRRL